MPDVVTGKDAVRRGARMTGPLLFITSFAIGAGVRDAAGIWTPIQARPFAAYTKSIGGAIAAAELFNEPTIAASGSMKKILCRKYTRRTIVAANQLAACAEGMLKLPPRPTRVMASGISLNGRSLPAARLAKTGSEPKRTIEAEPRLQGRHDPPSSGFSSTGYTS